MGWGKAETHKIPVLQSFLHPPTRKKISHFCKLHRNKDHLIACSHQCQPRKNEFDIRGYPNPFSFPPSFILWQMPFAGVHRAFAFFPRLTQWGVDIGASPHQSLTEKVKSPGWPKSTWWPLSSGKSYPVLDTERKEGLVFLPWIKKVKNIERKKLLNLSCLWVIAPMEIAIEMPSSAVFWSP